MVAPVSISNSRPVPGAIAYFPTACTSENKAAAVVAVNAVPASACANTSPEELAANAVLLVASAVSFFKVRPASALPVAVTLSLSATVPVELPKPVMFSSAFATK